MIYPFADKLENWGSKYALVVLAAKRAKQIKSGAPPLIQTSSKNPLTIALEEISAGKITCEVAENDLPILTTTEPEIAQLLAIPHDLDTEEETSVSVASNDEDFEDWEEEEDVEEEVEEVPFGLLGADEEEEKDVEPLDVMSIVEEDEPKPKAKKSEVDADIDIDEIDVDVEIDEIDDTEDEVLEEE